MRPSPFSGLIVAAVLVTAASAFVAAATGAWDLALFSTAIALASVAAHTPAAPAVLAGVPLLIAASIGVADSRLRPLTFATIFAAAIACAAWSAARNAALTPARAALITSACLIPARFLPLQQEAAALALHLIVLLSACALAWFLADNRHSSREPGTANREPGTGNWRPASRNIDAVILATACGLVTQIEPERAALFCLVTAAAVVLIRWPGALPAAAAVAIPLVSGRWSWPIAAIAFFIAAMSARRLNRPKAASPLLVPLLRAGDLLALKPAAFVPRAFSSSAGLALLLALTVAGVWLRPFLVVLYALAAAVMLTTARREGAAPSPADRLPMIGSVALLTLLPWSGIIGATFPLPFTPAVLIGAAVVAFLTSAFATSRFTTIILSLAVCGTAALMIGDRDQLRGAAVSVGNGETAAFRLPHPLEEVAFIATAGDVATLDRGTVVGELVGVAKQGAYRRPIRIGDVVDWGVLRPSLLFAAHNASSDRPLYRLKGRGWNASLDQHSLLSAEFPAPVDYIELRGAPALGGKGRLQLQILEAAQ